MFTLGSARINVCKVHDIICNTCFKFRFVSSETLNSPKLIFPESAIPINVIFANVQFLTLLLTTGPFPIFFAQTQGGFSHDHRVTAVRPDALHHEPSALHDGPEEALGHIEVLQDLLVQLRGGHGPLGSAKHTGGMVDHCVTEFFTSRHLDT